MYYQFVIIINSFIFRVNVINRVTSVLSFIQQYTNLEWKKCQISEVYSPLQSSWYEKFWYHQQINI